LAVALLASACSSAEPSEPAARSEETAAPTPRFTPSAPALPPLPATLTGRADRTDGPLLVAKIDNTSQAHPQLGLTKADVVYIEQVEGGVTRLAAVYSSQFPKYVGPVRSARISDIELLRQYGTVGLVYSGSQRKLVGSLRAGKLKLLSFDDNRRGYARSPNRPATYDVIGTMSTLRKRAGKVDRPKKVGYVFGPAPAGGKSARRFAASFPGATVSGTWSEKQKRWLLSMDGRKDMAAEGGQLGPTTFIVQFVRITGSRYHDINGAVTPNSRTVGRGKALIFRGGKVYKARWSRSRASQPTSYTIGGRPAVLAPGQIWVALLGKGRPVRLA
jgi:hypothetical protein